MRPLQARPQRRRRHSAPRPCQQRAGQRRKHGQVQPFNRREQRDGQPTQRALQAPIHGQRVANPVTHQAPRERARNPACQRALPGGQSTLLALPRQRIQEWNRRQRRQNAQVQRREDGEQQQARGQTSQQRQLTPLHAQLSAGHAVPSAMLCIVALSNVTHRYSSLGGPQGRGDSLEVATVQHLRSLTVAAQ